MQLSIERDNFLKSLQLVTNVLEKRQTLPILSNVLLASEGDQLCLTGTDLEIEIEAFSQLSHTSSVPNKITLPGRKLLDICRNLPLESQINITLDEGKCILSSGDSCFSLTTLPADDFPNVSKEEDYFGITFKQAELLKLLQRTCFAIAQKDVRYYLNGMLLEIDVDQVSFVATDGHRLALNRIEKKSNLNQKMLAIIPRKGVFELIRLLSTQSQASEVQLLLSANHLLLQGEGFRFVTRLIEGQFPNYELVIPKQGDKTLMIETEALKQAVTRVSILSNERLQGVCLQLDTNRLCVLASNPEREEAKEELVIAYEQESLEIGFNASYLIDVLNTVVTDKVKLTFSTSSGAFLVEEDSNEEGNFSIFVVMPMRL